MILSMFKVTLLLACFAFAGHGRRVQVQTAPSEGSGRLVGEMVERRAPSTTSQLASLLMELNPQHAFIPSGGPLPASLHPKVRNLPSAIRRAQLMMQDPGVEVTENKIEQAFKQLRENLNDLPNSASGEAQISSFESLLLSSAVGVSAISPFVVGEDIVHAVVPTLGALVAAVGFSAEYSGKVEVARGKETAATALQAASEAELYLAQAERAKAIIPLCVGVSASTCAFSLVSPTIYKNLGLFTGLPEIFLLMPFIGTAAAVMSGLALADTLSLARRAGGIGARRFAKSADVSRTWLSATEQIESSARGTRQRWKDVALGVLPAPILGALMPGMVQFKSVVAAGCAAVQSAYCLTIAEYALASTTEAVALKMRSTAVADCYANQGARAGSILPFTSALSGLAAALTVAACEFLPVMPSPIASSALCVFFPGLGSIVAAAASISKVRCTLDARAATSAATRLADAPVSEKLKDPWSNTLKLVQSSIARGSRFLTGPRMKTA